MVIRSTWGCVKLLVLVKKTQHTHTVPSTGLQNAACSTFSILWECVVIQQFRVRAQRQDLETKRGVGIKKGGGDIMLNHAQITAEDGEKMTDTDSVKEDEISFIHTEKSEERC